MLLPRSSAVTPIRMSRLCQMRVPVLLKRLSSMRNLRQPSWSLDASAVEIGDRLLAPAARGRVRRVAPAGFHHGLILGGIDAAEHSAWLSLITALMRVETIDWLSWYDELVRAEDKLVQYAAATASASFTRAQL